MRRSRACIRCTSYDLGSRGLTVAASGLKAGETTDVVMVRPNGRRVIIATIVADAAGAISKTFTYLTKDAPTGDYQFRIEGAASGFQRGAVKVTTTPALTVKASATSVLVKKKAVLMVAGTNTSTVPLKVTVKTVFGNQTISKVKVGKPFAAGINT